MSLHVYKRRARRIFSLVAGLIALAVLLTSLSSCDNQTNPGSPTTMVVVDLFEHMPESREREAPAAITSDATVPWKFYEDRIAPSAFRDSKLKWDQFISFIKEDPLKRRVFKLLPNVDIEFEPKAYKKAAVGKWFRWSGRVTDQGKVVGEGIFLVDETNRKIAATIDYKDRVYEIAPLNFRSIMGDTRVYEIDPAQFPDEEDVLLTRDVLPAGGPTVDSGEACPTVPPAKKPMIDVLILYTESAWVKWLAKGLRDINDEIDLALEMTNQAFENSEIEAELRIAARKLVSHDIFEENQTLGHALSELRDSKSELGKNARKWRQEAGADLVSLWVADGESCGAASRSTKGGPEKEDGFSVVTVLCAAKMKSLAHEIGHNLGAWHTRKDENVSPEDLRSNFGHLSTAHKVRTIMASKTECANNGVYCRRVLHYSNPDIPYPGLRIMTGVRRGDRGAADNHHQLNSTACRVATFR